MPSAAISVRRNYELRRDGRGQLVVALPWRHIGCWPQCRPLLPADVGNQFERDLADVLDWELDQVVVVVE